VTVLLKLGRVAGSLVVKATHTDHGKTRWNEAGDAVTISSSRLLDGWWVVATYALWPDAAPALAELRVSPTEQALSSDGAPPEGLTSRPVRLTALTARELRKLSLREMEDLLVDDLRRYRDASTAHAERPARTKDTLLDLLLAVHTVTTTGARNVNPRVAKQLGLSVSQVRDRVFAARKRGLLTPATPGMGGGFITDKGRTLFDKAGGRDGTSVDRQRAASRSKEA